jgi:subtilisin family serine protease
VPPGGEDRFEAPDDQLSAGIVNGVVGETSPLAADTTGAVVVWSGMWDSGDSFRLHLSGHGSAELWIQSAGGIDDAAPIGPFFDGAVKAGTVNIPASHPDLIAVGCSVNRGDWVDAAGNTERYPSTSLLSRPVDSVCYFSSAGPTATGAMKPEISAPGALVVAAMSREAAPGQVHSGSIFDAPVGLCPDGDSDCYVVDSSHALLSGTSMSAPQVAGAVALLFERDRTLTQPDVSYLLQAGARNPQGLVPFDYQLGPGLLDVEGMMAAYDAMGDPTVREPDAKKSWMSLSASYARPDPTWPIVGTVEVRTSDGAPAVGFDRTRLALAVTNASVRKPLASIKPGLFRFELAAAPESGQDTLDVRVTLDGQLIGDPASNLSGHRVLPISVDAWVAAGGVDARGSGCTVANGGVGRAGRASLPAFLTFGLAALGRWTIAARGSRGSRATRRGSRRDRRGDRGRRFLRR